MLNIKMFLIACPLLFFAGLVDAIGGGGGLISLPAFLLAGLPAHTAIATNKISSSMGTAVATVRLCRGGNVYWKLAIFSVVIAILGSSLGASLTLLVDESVMVYILAGMLPVTAFIVLNKKLFSDRSAEEVQGLTGKTYVIAALAAFIIGVYDGFYGPGTGTFLLLAFTVFAKMNIKTANAHTKIINLTTGLSSLVVFLLNGEGVIVLGLCAGICNMAGGWIGAGLMLKNGTKIVRPAIILVLILLIVKVFIIK